MPTAEELPHVDFDVTMIRDVIVVLVPMILSLSVHEYAHAWSAFKLGDDTASSQGRLTLNPIAHIDILGTLILPIILTIQGGFFFGWAKPVPVSPHKFRRTITMRNGMILTALAGPASNILIAFVVGFVAMLLYSDTIAWLAPQTGDSRFTALMVLGTPEFVADNAKLLARHDFAGWHGTAAMLLSRFFSINILLAVFNLLPVPPLDGSRVLPLTVQAKLARFTMVVFIGLMVLIYAFGGILAIPMYVIGDGLLGLWSLVF
jgi:Zn-dependent protease